MSKSQSCSATQSGSGSLDQSSAVTGVAQLSTSDVTDESLERPYPLPNNEKGRLAELRRYRVLDSAPEEMFEDIVKLAQSLFGVDVALISFVDDERQWFKAKVGVNVRETGREVAFCTYAILTNSVFVVPDAREDARFANNPLVTDAPFIRFYAGAPLTTPAGFNIGTLCIFDARSRGSFSIDNQQHLAALALMVCDRLNVRRLKMEREEQAASIVQVAEALTVSAADLDAQSQSLVSMAVGSSRRSESAAKDARLLSEAGEVVKSALHSISVNVSEANADVDLAYTAMQSMDVVVAGIGRVAGEIAMIATQSRNLSINASIEAARAGDSSLGFGAVAGEVKQLASKTSLATKDIAVELDLVASSVAACLRHCNRLNDTIAALGRTTNAVARQATFQMMANDRVLVEIEDVVGTTAEVQAQAVGIFHTSEQLLTYANGLKCQATAMHGA